MSRAIKALWFSTFVLGGYVFLRSMRSDSVTTPRLPRTHGESEALTPAEWEALTGVPEFWRIINAQGLHDFEAANDEFEIRFLLRAFEHDYRHGFYDSDGRS